MKDQKAILLLQGLGVDQVTITNILNGKDFSLERALSIIKTNEGNRITSAQEGLRRKICLLDLENKELQSANKFLSDQQKTDRYKIYMATIRIRQLLEKIQKLEGIQEEAESDQFV